MSCIKNKLEETLVSIFHVLWIFILITTTALWLPGVPTWPMFMFSIFFSIYKDSKKLPELLLQAFLGLLLAYIYHMFSAFLFSVWPCAAAKLLPLLPILAIILFGCRWVPKCLSLVSFAYFTIALIEHDCLNEPLELVAMLVLGSLLQIGVTILAEKGINLFCERKT